MNKEKLSYTTPELKEKITAYLQSRCVIPGSLPIWEQYLTKLCLAWGENVTEIKPIHVVYAADNGITEEPHIQYPREITCFHSLNMLHGGATISAYCHFNQIPLLVADVGIAHEKSVGLNLKAAQGTKNFTKEAAMAESEFTHVWEGATLLMGQQKEKGYNLISFGEMGIGNTTTSAAVLSALGNLPVTETVGAGSGASDEIWRQKCDVVEKGLALHQAYLQTPKEILRRVGGFDLVALTASMVACAELNLPFVIDGYITAIALVAATRLNPAVIHFAIPSHLSRETGMKAALKLAGLNPDEVVIHAQMALGEGSGAVLMVQMLRTVHYAFHHIISLEDIFKESFD